MVEPLGRAGCVLLCLLGLASSACDPGRVRRPNILFVLVDALRADHLELYGYHRQTAPALTGFARRALVFETAISQAGCTFPSVNSLLTSRYPAQFLGQPQRRMTIPEEVPSLPEVLRAAGYHTAGVSGSPVIRSRPSRVNPFGGFGRGYDSFDDDCWRRGGGCVNARAARALAALREPFFLYLHYMEPHAPYRPPPSFPRAFGTLPRARSFIQRGDPRMLLDALYRGGPPLRMSRDDVRQLRATYDEEIRYFDHLFTEVIADLGSRGLFERTLVVVLADHGEELLDHGHSGHCRDMAFQSVLHTPLVMRLPGGPPGRRIPGIAQNLDVVPTLLDYAGIECERCAFQGRSLRPLVERGTRVNRYAFSLQGRTRTIFDGRYKVSLDLGTGVAAFFDLQVDPGESAPGGVPPAVAQRLSEVLRAWIARHESGEDSVERAREVEQQLRAVGYL